jgi:hypothetical protein
VIRTMSIAAARAVLSDLGEEAITFIAPILDDVESITIADHDLEADTLTLESEIPLLVRGNVRCGGLVATLEHSPLFVLGDLHARDVFVSHACYVGGSLRATGLVYLNSLNDYSTCIAGDLEAQLVIEQGMATYVGGEIRGRALSIQNHVLSKKTGSVPRSMVEAIAQYLVPAALDDDGDLRGGIHRLLTAGQPVLR